MFTELIHPGWLPVFVGVLGLLALTYGLTTGEPIAAVFGTVVVAGTWLIVSVV